MFVDAINFTDPAKSLRVKANSKPWFNYWITSVIQKKHELFLKNQKFILRKMAQFDSKHWEM